MKEVKFYSMFSVNTFMLTDNAYLSQKQFYLRCLPTAFKFLFCYFSFSSFVSFGNFIIASLINFFITVYIIQYIISQNWLCFGDVDTDGTLSLLNLGFPTIIFLTSE